MATRIVVLGCGFAGLEAAFWLRRLDGTIAISVVNTSDIMVYTPSLIWLLPHRKTLEDISFELEPILQRKNIEFFHDEAVELDTPVSSIRLASGKKLDYDYLIIAAGWRSKRRHIEGSENVLFPCDLADVLILARLMDEMAGGSITFAIEGERPGPGAEFIGWIELYLQEKRVRDKFTLNLAEEKHRLLIHLGKDACNLVTSNFQVRGINLYLGMNLIAARPGMAILEGGVEVPSDVICAVGRLEAPELLRQLDFSDDDGFIPVYDDLSCKAYSNIYVAGDAARFDVRDVPKVAHLAIQQGKLAAMNIQAMIAGKEKHAFDAKNAFKNLFILPDMGGIAVMTKNLELIQSGVYLSSIKENIERYYLYTHRRGMPFSPLGSTKPAA